MSGTVDEGDDADVHANEEQSDPSDAGEEDGNSAVTDESDPAERRCGISLGEK